MESGEFISGQVSRVRMDQLHTDQAPKAIVVSVPHSGTRTLCQELRLSPHYHFGRAGGRRYLDYAGVMNIPIRNPLSVARSWANRGKRLDDLLDRFVSMFVVIEQKDPVLHRMEDRQGRIGHAMMVTGAKKIAEFQDAVMAEVVEPRIDFWERFYAFD